MTTAATDPRPSYAAATEWIHSLASGITDDQLTLPTPCDEFDVRTLLAHLGATFVRAEALAVSGTVEGSPFIADFHDAAALADQRSRALAAWETADLARPVVVPWGTVPGFAALGMYVNETLVHGWDLAVATGQDPEFPDAGLAEATLAVVQQVLPPEIRVGDEVPFGPVVFPRSEAGPTERLANWCGHSAESLG